MSKSPTLDTAQAVSVAQFDRQSNRYGKSHILADTSDLAEAFNRISLLPGEEVVPALDVATGGGHTALYLARKGWRVTAGDVSARMLENATKLLKDEGLELTTRVFPAEEIPFPEATFDLVTVRFAPHHFSSPEKFVAEVALVLKPGGHFILIGGTVPDNDPATETWLHQVEKWRDPSHGRFLSGIVLEELVSAHGLNLIASALHDKKQPDLQWNFETAATTPKNRDQVLEAVRTIPDSVCQALRLHEEEGKIVWWWPILSLVAQK